MVVDNIKNIGLYTKLHQAMNSAVKFFNETDLLKLEPGKHEIDGDNIFALVQEYTTKDENEGKWEAHKKYIDIQYIAKGNEKSGWMPVSKLALTEEYSAEKDVAFFGNVDTFTSIILSEGTFAIFLPDDAHKPSCTITKAENVKKVLVKIKL